MSPVGSSKNGTLNEMYNPSYYSISLASCPPIATSHTPVSAPTFSASFQTEQVYHLKIILMFNQNF